MAVIIIVMLTAFFLYKSNITVREYVQFYSTLCNALPLLFFFNVRMEKKEYKFVYNFEVFFLSAQLQKSILIILVRIDARYCTENIGIASNVKTKCRRNLNYELC